MTTAVISKAIDLEEPIERGETKIASIKLRRPGAPELRGLNWGSLTSMDVETIDKLMPRISMPPLTQEEVDAMCPADKLQCVEEIGIFFMTRKMKADLLGH